MTPGGTAEMEPGASRYSARPEARHYFNERQHLCHNAIQEH